ncbi:calcyphosin-like protein isoform X2 [Mytilus galloprovincialis]|uniref:calcyphosin-like protein isoform X2 n=1 Tax=Mytilus galloprovincialis TaxID=29158 RepID=UPI003F7C5C51
MSDENRTVQLLIGALHDQCLLKGHNGIRGLGLVFRRMDIDFSKGIVYPEFKIAIDRYGLKMSEGYSKTFFNALDKDKSGAIDFAELMNALRSPMNERRTNVVKEAFDNFDVNTDGKLSLDDLRVFYTANAKNHPKYLSGEWTLDQTLRSFLDSIDSPDDPDGVVTREEFLDYYAGVSATIDDDSYFVMMMRSCYGLPQR